MSVSTNFVSTNCKEKCAYPSLKSLQILEALTLRNDYFSVSEISDITGLNASTAHRVLQELVETGYAVKNESRKYRLGFGAMSLGMRMRNSDYLLEAARDEMMRLNDLSTETIHLIALDNVQGIYIGKVEAKNQIGLRSQIGWNIPLYCTSGGKAILANQSEEWLQSYLRNVTREAFTENTFVDENDLRKELEHIREVGFSLDQREHHTDIVCIAAPIFGIGGTVMCSIGISAPDYRFSVEKAISFAEEVKASAAAVSRRLQNG